MCFVPGRVRCGALQRFVILSEAKRKCKSFLHISNIRNILSIIYNSNSAAPPPPVQAPLRCRCAGLSPLRETDASPPSQSRGDPARRSPDVPLYLKAGSETSVNLTHRSPLCHLPVPESPPGIPEVPRNFTSLFSALPPYPAAPTGDSDHFCRSDRRPPSACRSAGAGQAF